MKMRVCGALLMLLMACKSKTETPPAVAPAKPQKLQPLERVRPDPDSGAAVGDTRFEIAPFAPRGPAAPTEVQTVLLKGDAGPVTLEGDKPVLLKPDGETYLAQVLPLLAQLDDAHRTVYLGDATQAFAFQLVLRDEAAFQAWVDEPTPGKLRIVQRADGFELQTNMGKLPGADPNGPSVPNRGGLDLPTLQKGLLSIKGRFTEAPDVCFMPTYGTTLADIARGLQANFTDAEHPIFEKLCLVYPRPAAADSGGGR